MRMIRALIIAACLAVSPVFALPSNAAPQPLAAHLQAIVRAPGNAHASFGIAVYDLDSGRFLYGMNENRYFLAASTTKLLTEGTTLSLLGGDYRFRTSVYRTGPIDKSGTLHGDLVMLAGGDPNLSGRIRPDGTLAFENEDHSYDGSPDTKAVPGDPLLVLHDFAQQIAQHGIKHVSGRVLVDDTLYTAGFPEPGTGAVVSPIMVNDNIVDVTVTPGAKIGDPTTFTVSPQTAYVNFVNRSTTAQAGTDRSITLKDADTGSGGD